jgi:hypothetical protein
MQNVSLRYQKDWEAILNYLILGISNPILKRKMHSLVLSAEGFDNSTEALLGHGKMWPDAKAKGKVDLTT